MADMTLAEAIAEVKPHSNWTGAHFLPTLFRTEIRDAIATILNAVLSGDLIPRADAELAVGDSLHWQSLHGWEPDEGTWAILWPGYYGPFTACWLNGGWSICEDSDLRHATVGAEIALPHLATDAIPAADRAALDEDARHD